MKNFNLKIAMFFLFAILLFSGCRKETLDTSVATANTPLFAPKSEKYCQLVKAENSDPSIIQNFKFYYNADGLAEKWEISNYGIFTQKFSADGKILNSRYIVDNTLIASIDFIYNKNRRLVKNVFYDGNSSIVTDEVFYTYNADGKLIRAQSYINDYMAVTKYTPEGNILSNELLMGGSRVYIEIYSYKNAYKNPYKTVSGIDIAFPYYTPASYFSSNSLFASERLIMYDVSGIPYLIFDDDAGRTAWQINKQYYPVSVTYFDLLSTATYTNRFTYMNCTGGTDISASIDKPVTSLPENMITKNNNIPDLLKRDPTKSLKQKVDEARSLLKYYPKL